MNRSLVGSMLYLAVIGTVLAACGGPAVANDPAVTATLEPSEPTTEAGGVVSHGGPAVGYVSLVDHLRAAGASVEPAGEVEQAFFGPTGQVIKVNGAEVQVFEYPDEAATEAEAGLVAADGGSVGTTMVTWVATPHFYRAGKLIVLYVGDDSAVTTLLASVLGPQFAGR